MWHTQWKSLSWSIQSIASLRLGTAYYSKIWMTEFFKCTWKAALYSNLQIIWEENGSTQVFAEILNSSEVRPILSLSSISDKVGFRSLGLFSNSYFLFNRTEKLLPKPPLVKKWDLLVCSTSALQTAIVPAPRGRFYKHLSAERLCIRCTVVWGACVLLHAQGRCSPNTQPPFTPH